MEIVVVGNDDFVTGFALAGVRYVFSSEANLEEEVQKALDERDVGILVMEEDQFKLLNYKTRKMLDRLVRPVLVLISDKGRGSDIREMIKKSLGVDLWQ